MKLTTHQKNVLRVLLYAHDKYGDNRIPLWVLETIKTKTLVALERKNLLRGQRLTLQAVRRARGIDRAWRREQEEMRKRLRRKGVLR